MSKVPIIQKSILPEESMKHVDKVHPINEPIVKQAVTENSTRTCKAGSQYRTCIYLARHSIIKNDKRHEKPANDDPIYRPPPKPMESPTQLCPEHSQEK